MFKHNESEFQDPKMDVLYHIKPSSFSFSLWNGNNSDCIAFMLFLNSIPYNFPYHVHFPYEIAKKWLYSIYEIVIVYPIILHTMFIFPIKCGNRWLLKYQFKWKYHMVHFPNEIPTIFLWLVVYLPLWKNMCSSVGMIIPNWMEK